jgi:hypothetical protein
LVVLECSTLTPVATNRQAGWPGFAIAIGLLGGLPTCGYGGLQWVGSGLGWCDSQGCEDRARSESNSGLGLMMLGGFVGGCLVAAGVVGRRANRAARQLQDAAVALSIPEAVVSRSSDPATPPSEP